jgi:hypothetical protein
MNSVQRTFFVSRNRLIFMRKYAGALKFFPFLFLFYPALSVVYLGAIMTSKHDGVNRMRWFTSYFLGTFDGLKWKDSSTVS